MRVLLIGGLLLAASPVLAQQPMPVPGKAEVSRVAAGTYSVDPDHTQAIFTVDHMGFTPLSGMIAGAKGALTIDPAHPGQAKVDVTFDVNNIEGGVEEFTHHLKTPDFFDAEKYPTIHFVSTKVVASGTHATITGNLTIHGVTKPVTLDATFMGAGTNPMNKKGYIGFYGKTTIRRSDFGVGKYVPLVSDSVKLTLHAGFIRE
ncbi:YceI family protein [Stakelama sediminis]|uniref:Polyisoprenoid-binding protein YceI n=1 Tax=Stakelama sediminis TaxID=463200 RepID=A0A840YUD2_9SPHN|nr:YceI family protein [Stakelama sediminis]MBB5717251.1 polyisoprenoid-binding protein YceI [Stakelama sediminis]